MSRQRISRNLLPCGRKRPGQHGAKEVFSDILDRLESYVAKNRLKKSRARKLILKTIFEQVRHFTVPELVQKVQIHNPDAAFATIYRSVPVFLEAGIIKRSLLSNSGQAIYELDFGEHHDHIVCRDCNEIFEFESADLESFLPKVAGQFGLSLTGHEHVLVGKCKYLKGGP